MNRLSSPIQETVACALGRKCVGVVLFLLFMAGWRVVHPAPEWIDNSDIGRLHALLDADKSPQGLYLFDDRCGYRFKPGYRGVRHQSVDLVHETNSLGLLGSVEPRWIHPTRVAAG